MSLKFFVNLSVSNNGELITLSLREILKLDNFFLKKVIVESILVYIFAPANKNSDTIRSNFGRDFG